MPERSEETNASTTPRVRTGAWYRQPEMVVGLSALMVSLVAVFVGVYSAYIDRSFARASVWPRLEVYRSYTSEPTTFNYQVRNSGTGPAIVQYAVVQVDDAPVARWPDLVTALAGDAALPFVQSHIGGRTLPADMLTEIFSTENEQLARVLRQHDDERIEIELCYCSIFDQCWRVDRRNEPESVKRCAIDEDQRFRQ